MSNIPDTLMKKMPGILAEYDSLICGNPLTET
jgi:hypothetical protein